MIKVGRYRILHQSEFAKFEKLRKIFRVYSDDDNLRRNAESL